MGMVNTFRSWDIIIAASTTHLRTLLQKGAVLKRDIYHQREFDSVKQIVSSPTFLNAFDINLKTNLLVDSSKEGIGYVLTQENLDGKISIIKCGSVGLSQTHSRYAPTELECLGISWAVRDNRIYLLGLERVYVFTDHRPLSGLEKKNIPDIDNVRLMRLVEHTSRYNLEITYVKGIKMAIADVLSRMIQNTRTLREDF